MEEEQEKYALGREQGSTEEERWETTTKETKEELAQMYLNFLDQQKWWILATGAGLGINLNPMQKDAIDYLTNESNNTEKKDIFSVIGRNIKKKFMERLSWWTILAYDKASLYKMKALIVQYKNDQAKLKELMAQIQAGTDPTQREETQATTAQEAESSAVVASAVPSSVTEGVVENMGREKKYVFPMPGNVVTSVKGPRRGREHNGIDIGGTEKTIKSIANGIVESVWFGSESAWFNGYGNYIVVKLDTGDRVLYGHMAALPSLKPGESVKLGDTIWIMGDTGRSTGVHLHLEIRKGGIDDEAKFFSREVIDPLTVISVSKDMVAPATLAYMNTSLLEETPSAMNA